MLKTFVHFLILSLLFFRLYWIFWVLQTTSMKDVLYIGNSLISFLTRRPTIDLNFCREPLLFSHFKTYMCHPPTTNLLNNSWSEFRESSTFPACDCSSKHFIFIILASNFRTLFFSQFRIHLLIFWIQIGGWTYQIVQGGSNEKSSGGNQNWYYLLFRS